jgi:hypothetical protein
MMGPSKRTEFLVIFGLLVAVAAGEVLPGMAWRKAALQVSLQPSGLHAFQEAVGPAAMAPLQWAELREQKDAVWYQSGAAGQRAQEQRQEEREKERQSWDRLRGMVIEEGRTREPALTPPPSDIERKLVK